VIFNILFTLLIQKEKEICGVFGLGVGYQVEISGKICMGYPSRPKSNNTIFYWPKTMTRCKNIF
jgi:hypothetical protein